MRISAPNPYDNPDYQGNPAGQLNENVRIGWRDEDLTTNTSWDTWYGLNGIWSNFAPERYPFTSVVSLNAKLHRFSDFGDATSLAMAFDGMFQHAQVGEMISRRHQERANVVHFDGHASGFGEDGLRQEYGDFDDLFRAQSIQGPNFRLDAR